MLEGMEITLSSNFSLPSAFSYLTQPEIHLWIAQTNVCPFASVSGAVLAECHTYSKHSPERGSIG